MLSYMRESQSDPLEQGSVNQVSPEGTEEPSSDSVFLTVSGREHSVRKSTTFVTALFIVASVGLVVMAKKSHVQSAGAAPAVDSQTQIEMAICRVTGVSSEMTGQMDEIVQKFYEFSDVYQVEVDELTKNPFQLVAMPAGLSHEDSSKEEEEQVNMLVQQFEQEKKGLSLVCIMESDSGECCMINDVLLKPGERVDNFVVEQIEKERVQLQWQPQGEISAELPSSASRVILALKE